MKFTTNRIKKTKQYIQTMNINWRFILLCNIITLAMFGLIFRITYLQIIDQDQLIHEGDMRSLRTQQLLITRGMIIDRTGHPLAVSVPVSTIWADPQKIIHDGGVINNERWRALSKALSLPLSKISSRIIKNYKKHFIYLARHIHPNVGDYINKLKLPGIYCCQESRRYYPMGPVVAHLIGITNIDNQGIEGIEKSFNQWLIGIPGKRTVRKDGFGQVIEDLSYIKSHEANNLILSIDARLQTLVYHKLYNAVLFNKAESGSAVLVDVNTGEILAIANSPSYNPNNVNNTMIGVMRNRAITDVFEPGSTVKPMVIMTALKLGIIKKDSVINTLPYIVNGHLIKDIICYPELSITGILQKSSNVGVSKLALAMPPSELVKTYSKFGLGTVTNLGLVGENSGMFPYKRTWSIMDRAAFSYGYGLMVTPLQLAQVYATIGSMGIRHPLSITWIKKPVTSIRVFPSSIVRMVIHMMESVALPGGCGVRAAIKGYRIAIKTGTAKKVGPNGNYINKYIAYTAGIAPVSKPRLALVVVINDPKGGKYYGGSVSAPVFGDIMGSVLRAMNIKPDALS